MQRATRQPGNVLYAVEQANVKTAAAHTSAPSVKATAIPQLRPLCRSRRPARQRRSETFPRPAQTTIAPIAAAPAIAAIAQWAIATSASAKAHWIAAPASVRAIASPAMAWADEIRIRSAEVFAGSPAADAAAQAPVPAATAWVRKPAAIATERAFASIAREPKSAPIVMARVPDHKMSNGGADAIVHPLLFCIRLPMNNRSKQRVHRKIIRSA